MRVVLFTLAICLSLQTWAAPPRHQDNSFKNTDKKVATLWSSIPFYPAGDIGQYTATMSQDRDSVRKNFFNELMNALNSLANKGAKPEKMIEPLVNALMLFDQVHDVHKALDVVKIDMSLEHQFKAALDGLFTKNEIGDDLRRIQIGKGTNEQLLAMYIKGISEKRPLGKRISPAEIDSRFALEIYNQIDYLAYGTFSSLGRGAFQVTLHLQGYKNGVTRNFTASGPLLAAIEDLALQVFDHFQANQYPGWQSPTPQLQWVKMPANMNREEGYAFEEAQSYCRSQRARLPYSRELLGTEAGGAYREGGIRSLNYKVSYPVLDRRRYNGRHVLIPGNEEMTGGAVQADQTPSLKGRFWCVIGSPSKEILFIEKLWELHRRNRRENRDVFAAVETIRYEIGDSDVDPLYFGSNFERLERFGSLEDALQVLRENGIQLEVPESLRDPQ